jgi:hypothetical protein
MEYPSRLDAVEANAQQKIFDRKVLRHSLASVFYLGSSYGSCGGQVLRVRYASRPGRLKERPITSLFTSARPGTSTA